MKWLPLTIQTKDFKSGLEKFEYSSTFYPWFIFGLI